MLRRALTLAAFVGASLAGLLASDAAFVAGDREQLAGHPPSWVIGGPRNAASVDFDFVNGRYWQMPPVYEVNPSKLLTTARSEADYAANSAGLLLLFPANVPRITNQGLLIEGAATNLCLQSRTLTNASWVKTSANVGTTPGADGTAGLPLKITSTLANATILQAITTASQSQTFSAYVKRVTGTGEVDITLDGGTTWTAITGSINTTSFVQVSQNQTLLNPSVGFRLVVSGDAIVIDFAQLETGAFATSPIVTTTVTASRTADAVSLTSLPGFGVGYTLFTKAVAPAAAVQASTPNAIHIGTIATPSNDRVLLQQAATSAATITITSATVGSAITLANWTAGTSGKLAAAIKAGAQSASFNGGAIGTQTSALPTAIQELFFGSQAGSTTPWYGYIQRVAVWPTVKQPNEFLQFITGANAGT